MIQILPLNNSLFYLPIKIGDRQRERLDTFDVGAQLDDVLHDARCLRLDALGLSAGGLVEWRARGGNSPEAYARNCGANIAKKRCSMSQFMLQTLNFGVKSGDLRQIVSTGDARRAPTHIFSRAIGGRRRVIGRLMAAMVDSSGRRLGVARVKFGVKREHSLFERLDYALATLELLVTRVDAPLQGGRRLANAAAASNLRAPRPGARRARCAVARARNCDARDRWRRQAARDFASKARFSPRLASPPPSPDRSIAPLRQRAKTGCV